MATLRARGLTFYYPGRQTPALEGINLDWREGEALLLMGPAGSGKSTLGRLLKGLAEPDSGIIELQGGDRSRRLTSHDLLRLVGWADAQPERQLFASTVRDEVAFGPGNAGVAGIALVERVIWALRAVGMDPQRFLARDPLTLSGGEKRLMALAGVIASPARFYLLDEPEAGLDEAGVEAVGRLLRHLRDEGVGTLVITPSPPSIEGGDKGGVDRLLVMDEGRLVADFPSEEVDWKRVRDWLERGGGQPMDVIPSIRKRAAEIGHSKE